jgi:hypothetical protein
VSFSTGNGIIPDKTSMMNSPVRSEDILDQNPEVHSPKWISIDTIGRHASGDVIRIRGLTNIAPGNNLLFSVYPTSFANDPALREFPSPNYIVRQISVEGNTSEPFTWFADLDTNLLKPDDYTVKIEGIVYSKTTSERFRLYGDSMNMNADQALVIREDGFWTNNQWNLTISEIDIWTTPPQAKMWVAYKGLRLGGVYVTPGYSSLWYSATPHDEKTPRLGIIISNIANETDGKTVHGTVSWNTMPDLLE